MSAAPKTEHTGIDAYPGVIATVITIIIGVVFVGGLWATAGGDHGEAAPTEAPAAEAH